MKLAVILLAVMGQLGVRGPGVAPGPSGTTSPVAGVVDFASFGSTSYGPGIPAPTIDCVAAASGGNMTCTGATATKAGNPTTSTSLFWRPLAVATEPSVVLDGTDDHYDLGTRSAPTGSISDVVVFRSDSTTCGPLITQDNLAVTRLWSLDVNCISPSAVQLYIAGSGTQQASIGSVVVGAWNVLVVSYEAAGAGSSKVRATLNGSVMTEITTFTAMGVGSEKLLIGARRLSNVLNSPLVGALRLVAHWDGIAFTTAQQATISRAMRALIATKPATTELSFARSDSTLCCPLRDSECHWLAAGVPCVRSDPDATGRLVGVEAYGAGANRLLQTKDAATENAIFENASWGKTGGVAVSDASASCPIGPTGARMSLVTASSAGQGIYQDTVGGVSRAVWMAHPVGGSACSVKLGDVILAATADFALTGSPVRYWSALAGTTGIAVVKSASGGCAAWCMWGAQSTTALTLAPFRSTTGTAYAGSAATATNLSVPVSLTNPARWCVGTRAALSKWLATGVYHHLLVFGGRTGANTMNLSPGGGDSNLYFEMRDSGGNNKAAYFNASSLLTDNSEHRVVVCNNAGTPRVFVDGIERALTISDSWTTTFTALPATIGIGYNPANGAEQASGQFGEVCQAETWQACERSLR